VDPKILAQVEDRMLQGGVAPNIVKARMSFLAVFDNPTHYSRYTALRDKHTRFTNTLNVKEQEESFEKPSFMDMRMQAVGLLRGKKIGKEETSAAESAVGIPKKFERGKNPYSNILSYPGGEK